MLRMAATYFRVLEKRIRNDHRLTQWLFHHVCRNRITELDQVIPDNTQFSIAWWTQISSDS